METYKRSARALATVLLNGEFASAELVQRAERFIGHRRAWVKRLAVCLVAELGEGTRPRRARVEKIILGDRRFREALQKLNLCSSGPPAEEPAMRPASGAPGTWQVPAIRTVGELARWLALEPNELWWLADCRNQEVTLPASPLRHYTYRWQPKRKGGTRLIESPKQRLKAIQRFLLREIISRIPPHDAVHGFRAQRSVQTFVAPHVQKPLVLRMDLKDFFVSVSRSRILAIFLTAGYPEPVAHLLSGLCTNATPRAVLKVRPAAGNSSEARLFAQRFRCPHLPQGAPTSPALANLAAFRMDMRLAGLAKAVGADYTRYADDLVLSGPQELGREVERLYIRACAIVLEEGFEVNTRKTRMMRPSVSQRAAGLVLNHHPNLPRAVFDRLKAIVHNCCVKGPESQNLQGLPDFRAHLAGRIAYAQLVNPTRAAKLVSEFAKIPW